MAIVIPSASEKTLLDFTLGVTTPGNQVMRLYVNNVSIADTDTAATYTEMSTLGYVAKTLTKTSWTAVAGSTGQPCTSTYATQTWTFTAGTPVSVFGYYVTDAGTGLLLWSEAFVAAKVVGNNGDQIIVIPTFTGSRS